MVDERLSESVEVAYAGFESWTAKEEYEVETDDEDGEVEPRVEVFLQ